MIIVEEFDTFGKSADLENVLLDLSFDDKIDVLEKYTSIDRDVSFVGRVNGNPFNSVLVSTFGNDYIGFLDCVAVDFSANEGYVIVDNETLTISSFKEITGYDIVTEYISEYLNRIVDYIIKNDEDFGVKAIRDVLSV